jgi:AraC-like DNA-binding protein
MKAVIRHRNDALRFVDRFCSEFGPEWEKPQIRELATEIGYSEDELKYYFKSSFGPQKNLFVLGEQKRIPKSTTEYSKLEMTEMIGHLERVGAELGFRFSDEIGVVK